MDHELTLLGATTWRGAHTRFGIKRRDRRSIYLLGKTGMGKSTLLMNIVLSDIRAGAGVAVIDPHGALVEELLDYIPDTRVEDVIYVNATDTERPVPLNPFTQGDPATHHLVASGIIAMMKKIWGRAGDRVSNTFSATRC